MKKHLLLVAMMLPSVIYAESGIYTSLKSGVSDYKMSDIEYSYSQPRTGIIVWEESSLENQDAKKSAYPAISIALGYDFSKNNHVNIRTELEYTYRNSFSLQPNTTTVNYTLTRPAGAPIAGSMKYSGKGLYVNELDIQSLMLNSYYDFKNTTKMTPYLGVGAGVVRIKNTQYSEPVSGDLTIKNSANNNFTWSAAAGVSYQVSSNVLLDLGYRYVDLGKINDKTTTFVDQKYVNSVTKAKLVSHDYTLGLRYYF